MTEHEKDCICHLCLPGSVREPDYSKMSQEDFDRILEKVVIQNLNEIMHIPGAYEVFSEHYNNKVLEEWEKEQLN